MNKEMRVVRLDDLKPYKNNPRRNDMAVPYVQESIQQVGYLSPIIVDENLEILAGHTRYKALRGLDREEAEVIVVTGLTEKQKKKYRILDNKVGEFASWDFEVLELELQGLDFAGFDFGFDGLTESKELDEDKYSSKTDIPQYEVVGENPNVLDLYDDQKTKELQYKIQNADLEEDVKEFLLKGAERHTRFNYSKIAEFYANASKEVQELMEESALVIIDFDDAIKNGYVKLSKKIAEMYKKDEK